MTIFKLIDGVEENRMHPNRHRQLPSEVEKCAIRPGDTLGIGFNITDSSDAPGHGKFEILDDEYITASYAEVIAQAVNDASIIGTYVDDPEHLDVVVFRPEHVLRISPRRRGKLRLMTLG